MRSCAVGVGFESHYLVVIEPAGTRNGNRLWKCQCRCGNVSIQTTNRLTRGDVRSCGCLRRESTVKHRKCRAPEYLAWRHIKSRCFDPECERYRWYGARGITMCERWRNSFTTFLADVGLRPSAGHSIDRIDNDGHYEPGNCRWAVREVQDNNRRDNVFVEHAGERLTIAQWARRLGMPHNTLKHRISKWGVERAMTEPVRVQFRRRPKAGS